MRYSALYYANARPSVFVYHTGDSVKNG